MSEWLQIVLASLAGVVVIAAVILTAVLVYIVVREFRDDR